MYSVGGQQAHLHEGLQASAVVGFAEALPHNIRVIAVNLGQQDQEANVCRTWATLDVSATVAACKGRV